jgi:hypothetical protein
MRNTSDFDLDAIFRPGFIPFMNRRCRKEAFRAAEARIKPASTDPPTIHECNWSAARRPKTS